MSGNRTDAGPQLTDRLREASISTLIKGELLVEAADLIESLEDHNEMLSALHVEDVERIKSLQAEAKDLEKGVEDVAAAYAKACDERAAAQAEVEKLRKQVDCLTNGNGQQGCGHDHTVRVDDSWRTNR